MKQTLTSDWSLFTEQAWFQNEGWTAFIAHYRDGIYMQIYKLHWYNQLHEGIHLELAQNEQLRNKKQINLELHAHKEGLGPIRDQLNDEIAVALQTFIQELGTPFEFREKSLSAKISATFACSPTNFAVKAAQQITLLRPIGKIIDDALIRLHIT